MADASTWTIRCAQMLCFELTAIRASELVEKIDGGVTASAIAAIAATPAGPRRAFEVQLWANRIAKDPTGLLMHVVTGATTDDELAAMHALGDALAAFDWSAVC